MGGGKQLDMLPLMSIRMPVVDRWTDIQVCNSGAKSEMEIPVCIW